MKVRNPDLIKLSVETYMEEVPPKPKSPPRVLQRIKSANRRPPHTVYIQASREEIRAVLNEHFSGRWTTK